MDNFLRRWNSLLRFFQFSLSPFCCSFPTYCLCFSSSATLLWYWRIGWIVINLSHYLRSSGSSLDRSFSSWSYWFWRWRFFEEFFDFRLCFLSGWECIDLLSMFTFPTRQHSEIHNLTVVKYDESASEPPFRFFASVDDSELAEFSLITLSFYTPSPPRRELI